MEREKLNNTSVLVTVLSALEEPTPVNVRALKVELEKIKPDRARQIYVNNLKIMLSNGVLKEARMSEKAYSQVINCLNEALRTSYYKSK